MTAKTQKPDEHTPSSRTVQEEGISAIEAGSGDLWITAISVCICNAGMRNWVFVRVETNQPGLIGWGEATLEFKTHAIAGAISDLAPLLVGEDPRNIEHCVQTMTRHSFWRLGVIGMSAVSGIEIALWDILGKDLQVPVWRLLGGSVRKYLRTYTHLGFGQMESVYETEDAGTLAERGRQVVDAGYDAVKVVCVPYSHYAPSYRDFAKVEKMLGGLRDAVGPEVDIMVDFHGRPPSARAALSYIGAIASAKLLFVEEPVPPEDMHANTRVTQTSPIPVASGERLIGRREFTPYIEARAFDIAQPDICHTGGLGETKKIAAMAETAGIGLAPHNPLGPIAGIAALHFGISTPNVFIQEEMSGAVPWYDEVVSWPIERRPGRWDRPELPGLGLDVNEKVLAEHPIQPDILHTKAAKMPDGTVVDW